MASRLKSDRRAFATPLVIGGYLVTALTGVMLFFHLGEGLVKGAHEWLGLLFVPAALLHLSHHWNPFKRYLSRGVPRSIIAATLVVALGFVATELATGSGGNPLHNAMHTIETAPLTVVAQLQQRDVTELLDTLKAAGFAEVEADESIATIAALHHTPSRQIFALLFAHGG
jgi:hypothetical protein